MGTGESWDEVPRLELYKVGWTVGQFHLLKKEFSGFFGYTVYCIPFDGCQGILDSASLICWMTEG